MNKAIFIGSIFLLLSSCNNKDRIFKVVSSSHSHIDFENQLTDSKTQNILDYLYYYNGGGVAVGDINNDGLPDIYFTSNQNKNKLYLNKGNLEFEDITEKAGVEGNSDWNSGVSMADVNQDGLLDIYVCAVVGIHGFEGANELFINNGDLTFTESAAKYGLDADNFSSNASFFDYDLDGDLDMYLLNHAVHTQESFGDTLARHQKNYETGDKLFKNEGGKFRDISDSAGIFGGTNGYGLGLSISDFNQDGYPDIYVGNDFHEDDYYYVNNRNGTFSNKQKSTFGHCSKFTMGMDNADINNDGYTDLITLDMLSEDPKVIQSSVNDDNFQLMRTRTQQLGFTYQYARNMLQINQLGEHFSEIALLAGVAATDWSWSALLADYDLDGKQDLYITNGIPKRPNDLDFIKFISDQNVRTKINHTNIIDKQALAQMPEAKLKNYFFLGNGNGTFNNNTQNGTDEKPGITTGAAYADLDNDGDLDLILNNINQKASILENTSFSNGNNFLKVKLTYKNPNIQGIGTKVIAYSKNSIQYKEMFTTRGFQSSSEPIVYFGFGNVKSIDSLKVVWNDSTYQVYKNVALNKTLKVDYKPLGKFRLPLVKNNAPKLFTDATQELGISTKHEENDLYDFNRQKLIPYAISTLGPALAVGDFNNDGKEDIFLGGAKFKNCELLLQQENGFVSKTPLEFNEDNSYEDVSAEMVDINNDGTQDLLIAEGGGEFSGNVKQLQNRYFLQQNGKFNLMQNPYFEDATVLKPIDIDKDGDLDLFVGCAYDSQDFGKIPASYILENKNNTWVKKQEFTDLGMLRDALITDYNKDNQPDIIVVGEWAEPKVLLNTQGKFQPESIVKSGLKGLWRAVSLFDIDTDGDLDICLGNWGENSKFNASEKHPLLMYHKDFDHNQNSETLLVNYTYGDYYSFYGLEMLQEQIPSFRKLYTNYKEFASKKFEDLLPKEYLDKAQLLQVETLSSGYLQNDSGNYHFIPFPKTLQVAPINCFVSTKIKGKNALICAGNFMGLTPYQGRFDAFSGAVIFSEKEIYEAYKIGLNLINLAVSKMKIIHLNQLPYLVVGVNNDQLKIFKIEQ